VLTIFEVQDAIIWGICEWAVDCGCPSTAAAKIKRMLRIKKRRKKYFLIY